MNTVNVDGLSIGEGHPVRIMGVINLSPESFYKKSVVIDKESIQQRIERMEGEGADIIDVGFVSTAPSNIYNTPDVSKKEEVRRVKKALPYIVDSTNLPISIDTVSSEVGEIAIDMGVSMINDISGFQADTEMVDIIHSKECPVILMANCGSPCKSLDAVLASLEKSYSLAISANIDLEKIILDPGIGFGKPAKVDLEILRNLQLFARYGQPLLVGVSRKAFIGSLLDQQDPNERLTGSLAATTIVVYQGIDMIRTHDVKESKVAIQIGEAILRQRLRTRD